MITLWVRKVIAERLSTAVQVPLGSRSSRLWRPAGGWVFCVIPLGSPLTDEGTVVQTGPLPSAHSPQGRIPRPARRVTLVTLEVS